MSGRAADGAQSALRTSAQFLTFDPGLYAIEIAAARTVLSDIGVHLPSIRIETLPPTRARAGRATLVTTSPEGWLCQTDDPAFVLVVGGRAGAVLTIYRADDNTPPPSIRVRNVNVGNQPAQAQAAALRPVPDPRPEPAAAPPRLDPDTLPIRVLAHVAKMGDIVDTGGKWVGKPGGRMPVEGFTIIPEAEIAPEDLEYQAILGANWNTPWFRGGEFCGSRGLMLPILGFRVRLLGAAAEAFACTYSGIFVGGKVVGPVEAGEACEAGDVLMEALMVGITRRQADAPVVISDAVAPAAPEEEQEFGASTGRPRVRTPVAKPRAAARKP